jgi:hypothetical protein
MKIHLTTVLVVLKLGDLPVLVPHLELVVMVKVLAVETAVNLVLLALAELVEGTRLVTVKLVSELEYLEECHYVQNDLNN